MPIPRAHPLQPRIQLAEPGRRGAGAQLRDSHGALGSRAGHALAARTVGYATGAKPGAEPLLPASGRNPAHLGLSDPGQSPAKHNPLTGAVKPHTPAMYAAE